MGSDTEHGDHDEPSPPHDAMTAEPPVFGEARHTVLSPSGQFESERAFARGLGARRMKLLIFGGGAVAMLLALLAALR